MELTHEGRIFSINEKRAAARSNLFDVYVCSIDGQENAGLLKIATSSTNNPVMDREAIVLQILKEESEKWDESYHFDWLYPNLEASFPYKEEGAADRQINILSLRKVEDVTQLHAIAQIIGSGHRVDTRTAIWIFGRMLKLLMFIHPRGYSVEMTASKMLIHPGKEMEVLHQAILFDWTGTQIHGDEVPIAFRQRDIKMSAKTILELLGANSNTGEYPYEDEHGFVEYVFCLTKNDGNTKGVFEAYYRYVYDVFGQGFHPFTTFPK